jgi:proteic killer suppression protein
VARLPALNSLCNLQGVTRIVIKSFRHKGLERLFRSGAVHGVNSAHAARLRLVLSNLDVAKSVHDMDLPGLRLHMLKGDRKDTWSVQVSANWRVTFQFVRQHVEYVDYEDYH